MKGPGIAVLGTIGVLILVMGFSLGLGAVPLSLSEIWLALQRQGDPLHQTILWDLRLPRVLLGGGVGAALGMSGGLMQGMLRNGLADPFLLGISAGAGLAAVIPLTQGEWVSWVPLAAWAGGMSTTAVVYALAWTPTGIAVERLLLSGVAISALLGSITSMILLFADDRVQVALNWLIGSLNGRGWEEVQTIGGYVAVGLALGCGLAKFLDILSLGDETATSLGLSLKWLRLALGMTAAGLTAAAVSVSGLIGFVGLVVPHLARLCVGKSYSWVIPMSSLIGAVLLLLADTLARLGSIELPVGALTALIGAPFFMGLLHQRSSGR